MMIYPATLARICLAGLALFQSLPITSAQDVAKDLGEVLESRKDLSTFNKLIRDYPEILLKLPNYGGVTIVAPSNEAFENIAGTPLNEVWDPKNASIAVPILEYHILQGTISTGALVVGPSVFTHTLLLSRDWTNVTAGQNVVVNKQPGEVIVFTSSQGARTTQSKGDIRFSGGLIHVVDNLLIPPTRLESTLEAFGLDSFFGALHAAELLPQIAEETNVTIFAPRDEALKLVGGALSDLDTEALKRVVGYHVVPGKVVPSAELTNGTRLTTHADDAAVAIRRSGNDLFVNSAKVVQPDILIANGVLHIVENVLNPDASAVVPDPEAATQGPVWPVSEAEGVPFTSAIPCSIDCPVTTSSEPPTRTSSASSEQTSEDGGSGPDNGARRGVEGARFGGVVAALGVGLMVAV